MTLEHQVHDSSAPHTPATASASAADAEVSAVPDMRAAAWQRVAKSYAWVDLFSNLVGVALLAGVYAVFWSLGWLQWDYAWLLHLGAGVLALLAVVSALLAFRRVRLMGYILREDDLLFRRGIMFERVVAVPYGRLQLVDIHRGPLLRAFGLASLKFVTAAAATGVQLPGLPLAEAERLRDELVRLAEIRRSGL